MIVELRQKAQVTIPSEITKKLSLKVGDKFEVILKDGVLMFIPVAVYPKSYVEEIKEEIKNLKKQIESGEAKTFSNLDEMIKSLDED